MAVFSLQRAMGSIPAVVVLPSRERIVSRRWLSPALFLRPHVPSKVIKDSLPAPALPSLASILDENASPSRKSTILFVGMPIVRR
jgi:hypothetical protein